MDLRVRSATIRTTGQIEAIFVKAGYSLLSQLQGFPVKMLSKILLSNRTWALRQSWLFSHLQEMKISLKTHILVFIFPVSQCPSPHLFLFDWFGLFFRFHILMLVLCAVLFSVLSSNSFTQWQQNYRYWLPLSPFLFSLWRAASLASFINNQENINSSFI